MPLRKRYDPETRAKVLAAVGAGKAVPAVAKEFEISPANIYKWVQEEKGTKPKKKIKIKLRPKAKAKPKPKAKAKADGAPQKPNGTFAASLLGEMQKELRRVTRERDALHDALVVLASRMSRAANPASSTSDVS